MTIRLRPPKSQLLQLQAIAEIGADKLQEILARFAEQSRLLLHPAELVKVASELCDQNSAGKLVSQLVSFHTLIRKTDLSAIEVVDSIAEALENESAATSQSWAQVSKVFAELLSSRQVRVAATAVDLTYDYANLVRKIRIITDVRPLFDESAEGIEAAVVSFTMRLHYDSADGNHELSLALDRKDLDDLIAKCQRAIKKSETAKSMLLDPLEIPGVITGDFTKGNK